MGRFDLSPRMALTCAKTDKFKTGGLSVNLISQLAPETASLNALLPRVLKRGSSVHTDMESISRVTDELYGAKVEAIIRKRGELQSIGFYAEFIDDDFVPAGENILERVTELVGELLLKPKLHGGLLLSEYVDSERSNLIDEIRAAINDKRRYALDALLRNMCAEEPFGTNKLGTEAEAGQITAKTLTEQYRKLLDTARIEVFYCGMAEPERVKLVVRDALLGLPNTGRPEVMSTNILFEPPVVSPREFHEKLDVSQGKLAMGFRLGRTMLEPDYPALAVFNALFGGSVTSKLFLNVRERLSLCYYASSSIEKHKGIMTVSSGVEFENFRKAHDEILTQLEAIKNGEVSDWEFISARRAVVTAQLAELDRMDGLEDACFDGMIAKLPYTPDQLAALAETASRERVIEIANSVKLDSVYYLEGADTN